MAVTVVLGENSYISVDDAEEYFLQRLHSSAWDGAVPDDKSKALIMATKKIDRQPLRGIKTDSSQVLEFPRALRSDSQQRMVAQSEVPQAVKDACCEEALMLLQGIPKRTELQRQGVKSMSIGNLSETYTGTVTRLLSQEAKELLQSYLAGSVAIC